MIQAQLAKVNEVHMLLNEEPRTCARDDHHAILRVGPLLVPLLRHVNRLYPMVVRRTGKENGHNTREMCQIA